MAICLLPFAIFSSQAVLDRKRQSFLREKGSKSRLIYFTRSETKANKFSTRYLKNSRYNFITATLILNYKKVILGSLILSDITFIEALVIKLYASFSILRLQLI